MNLLAMKQLVMSPFANRRTMGSMWPAWFVFAAAALLATIPHLSHGKFNPWVGSLVIFICISFANVFLFWCLLVSNLVRQCSPINLQLVPGMRRHAAAVFLLAWLAASAIPAALMSLVLGNFILIWFVASFFLLTFVLTIALGKGIFLLPFFAAVFMARQIETFVKTSGLLEGDPQANLLMGALLLTYAGLCATIIFGARGDRALKQQLAIDKLAQWQRTGTLPLSDSWGKYLSNTHWAYEWRLARLLNGRPANASRRIELFNMGFGRNLHWSSLAATVFILLVLSAILFAVHIGLPSLRESVRGLAFALAVNAVIQLSVIGSFAFIQTLFSTQKEQALLKLLPGTPTATSLNRHLAKTGVWRLGAGWMLAATSVLASTAWTSYAFDTSVMDAMHIVVPLLAAGLVSLPFILRPYARMGKPHIKDIGIPGALCLLPLAAIFMPVDIMSLPLTVSILVFPLLVCAVIFRSRWRATVEAPIALPVGRLSKASQ
jgi:hypothetical protein